MALFESGLSKFALVFAILALAYLHGEVMYGEWGIGKLDQQIGIVFLASSILVFLGGTIDMVAFLYEKIMGRPVFWVANSRLLIGIFPVAVFLVAFCWYSFSFFRMAAGA